MCDKIIESAQTLRYILIKFFKTMSLSSKIKMNLSTSKTLFNSHYIGTRLSFEIFIVKSFLAACTKFAKS